MDENIHELLLNRRKELVLTQLEVAKFCGVSEATVSRWESGNIANMRRSKVASLAKILKLDPAIIIGTKNFDNEELSEDDDLMALREQLRRSPETRLLFDATKNCTPEQIKIVAEMITKWKDTSQG